MNYGIVYGIIESLRAHINSVWSGDVYDNTGALVRAGFCPAPLVSMLAYTDREGTERIFGPSTVVLNRLQEDSLNLANNLAVPSSYIEVIETDYEDIESWRHSIYKNMDGSQQLGGDFPTVMVGGLHGYTRRITVQMTTYFLESNQDEAEVSRLGNAALSFLESMLTSYGEVPNPWAWQMKDEDGQRLKDPFGESPWRAYPVISHVRRRGGPPDDYIYDIKIYLEINTWKDS